MSSDISRGKGALQSLAAKFPLTSGLKDLSAAPRCFLLFIVFNVVSWQCIIGPANVLFARKIGMPPSWVGFLLAFAPLSSTLVVGTGLLVMHWGAKRVMFFGWLLRNLLSCMIFLLPLAVMKWGPPGGWWMVMASTLGFCLMRAVGVGGWFPWLHEVVPEEQRGVYFGQEASVTQFLNIAIQTAQALILLGDPGVGRFLAVYAIGIISGFASLLLMKRIPGGAPSRGEVSLKMDIDSYRRAFADRRYMFFIITASLCFGMTSWLGGSYVMFMRDALGLTSLTIMGITAISSVCVMLSVRNWARFAERCGSGRAISMAQVGHACGSLCCLLLVPGTVWAQWAIAPIIIMTTLFGAAYWMSVHRAMMRFVKTEDRVGYTNLWTVFTAIALGVVPVLAGMAIDHFGEWGFRFCFSMAGFGGLCSAFLMRRAAGDGSPINLPANPLQWVMVGPRILKRIARVTLGFDK
jgi:MFS family permease